MRILLVEDNPEVVALAILCLTNAGHEVVHYADYSSFKDGNRRTDPHPRTNNTWDGWYDIDDKYERVPNVDICITDLWIPSSGAGSFNTANKLYPGGAYPKYTPPQILGVGVYLTMKQNKIPCIIVTDSYHHEAGDTEVANKLVRACDDGLVDLAKKTSSDYWTHLISSIETGMLKRTMNGRFIEFNMQRLMS